MTILLAADHRGFALKEKIMSSSNDAGLTVIDCGPTIYDSTDDYVDYARKALDPATWLPDHRAILICGSGHGMNIVANRYPHIRAILGFNLDVVKQGREHEDANVLVLPSDWLTEDQAKMFVAAFINTPFSHDPRHLRRLHKLAKISDA